MKHKKTAAATISIALSLALLTGCSSADQNNSTTSPASSSTAATIETAANSTSAQSIAASTALEQVRFDTSDYYFNWQSGTYTTLDMSGGSQTITKSGTYEITGTLADGSLTVDVDNSADNRIVYLVLNNASISSSTSAPIYVKDAAKVVLILENGTSNTMSQGSGVIVNADNEPSAAVFSKADLTITGAGTLNVLSDFNDGITCKDTLKITDGDIIIQAKNDGITGKDLLAVENGSVTITAGKDGMRATNDTDAGMGSILINGGVFDINAGDDGIHADGSVTISGGALTIQNAYEAVEGKNITVNSGELTLTSSDDGFNVNDGAGLLTLSGGTIYVNANGDGLDSNGSVTMTGGTVYVDGPTNSGNGAIDYNSGFSISGGVLLAVGSSGMAQTGDTSSSQASILMYYSAAQAAGTEVCVKDESGIIVASFTPAKQYSSAAISAPGLQKGQTYTLYSGSTKVVTFTLSDTVTYLNASGVTTNQSMGPGGTFGGGGQFHGGPMNGTKPGSGSSFSKG